MLNSETLVTSTEESPRRQLAEPNAQTDKLKKRKKKKYESERRWLENNRDKLRERWRNYYRENRSGTFEKRLNGMFRGAKRRCKYKGVEFNITNDDVVRRETCPIIGIRFNFRANKISDDSPTLDRIDPSKGYVPGNVWVISYRANRIKSNATSEELLKIATAVKAAEDRLKMGLPACDAE